MKVQLLNQDLSFLIEFDAGDQKKPANLCRYNGRYYILTTLESEKWKEETFTYHEATNPPMWFFFDSDLKTK